MVENFPIVLHYRIIDKKLKFYMLTILKTNNIMNQDNMLPPTARQTKLEPSVLYFSLLTSFIVKTKCDTFRILNSLAVMFSHTYPRKTNLMDTKSVDLCRSW